MPTAIARALNNGLAMGGSRYRIPGTTSGPCDTAYLGVFRTSQLREMGGWSEPFATNQDFELNRRMAALGPVWFLDDIPVEYHPRRTLGELFHQYQRFGSWKVTYWQTTGDKPLPRQVTLVIAPVAAAIPAFLAFKAWPKAVAASALLAALGADQAGTDGPDVPPAGRLISVAAMAAVGGGWWSGVAKGALQALTRGRRGPIG